MWTLLSPTLLYKILLPEAVCGDMHAANPCTPAGDVADRPKLPAEKGMQTTNSNFLAHPLEQGHVTHAAALPQNPLLLLQWHPMSTAELYHPIPSSYMRMSTSPCATVHAYAALALCKLLQLHRWSCRQQASLHHAAARAGPSCTQDQV